MAATRYYNQDQDHSLVKAVYDSIETMRHQMGNHEAELRMFEDKLKNIEDAMEELRHSLDKIQLVQHELMSKGAGTLDTKVSAFVGDMKKLQKHANSSTTALENYQNQIVQLQKVIDARNKDLDHLKVAVKSIMSAIGSSDGFVDGQEVYKVKPGDSLGVIAQKLNKTIKEIKEYNHLKSDIIFVGQTLKIP